MANSKIGGQAVIEGIMMRNNSRYAIAVRDSKGEIILKEDEYKGICSNPTVKKIPVVRGVLGFIDSMVLGMKALDFSADIYAEEEEEKEKNKEKTDKNREIKEKFLTFLMVAVSMAFAIGLFMVAPYFISLLLTKKLDSHIWLALIEGLVRIVIFLLYLFFVTRIKDIRRVLMYHGAEHKCINCIESGKELTVENVRESSRFHKRCGTGFLLYIIVISIILFMLIDVKTVALRVLIRILLVPLIAGLAYELLRMSGNRDNAFINALTKPALALQKLTTKEPDDSMIEVGIKSVEAVFDWRTFINDSCKDS